MYNGKIKTEVKFIRGEKCFEGKYTPKNRFDFLGLMQSLKRGGYELAPHKLERDSNDYMTDICSVWIAFKGRTNIYIHYKASQNQSF
jgi:hypothetical protein